MPDVLAHIVGGGRGDGWDILARWSFDPTVLLAVLLPGVLYGRGMRRWTAQPRLMKPWQPYSFYAGLTVVFVALSSPLDALADDLFVMHMVQHLLLLMLAPPLILVGAPTTPVLLGLPRAARQHVVKPLMQSQAVRAAYRLITAPPVAFGLFVAAAWSWHFAPGAYDAALGNGALHIVQHMTFFGVGMLYWWTIIDPRPLRSRLAYPTRMGFIIATELQNVGLGAALTLQKSLLYTTYAAGPGLWGLSPLDDQQAGGATLWIGGVMMLLLALVVTGLVWFDKGEKQMRKAEAEADRRAQLAAGGGGGPVFGG
ncbi:MAG: cytochrome c oxidase assembly protein [Dehalococcoidia bacterium]